MNDDGCFEVGITTSGLPAIFNRECVVLKNTFLRSLSLSILSTFSSVVSLCACALTFSERFLVTSVDAFRCFMLHAAMFCFIFQVAGFPIVAVIVQLREIGVNCFHCAFMCVMGKFF
jgi:hypothetical protein